MCLVLSVAVIVVTAAVMLNTIVYHRSGYADSFGRFIYTNIYIDRKLDTTKIYWIGYTDAAQHSFHGVSNWNA